MAVNIWLECLRPGSSESCILAIGDNTSAIGWLHHTTNLLPDCAAHKAHLIVARHIATLLIENDCCIGTQHVKGELNVVTDLLSFVGNSRGKAHPLAFDNPPNDVLSYRFLNSPISNQVPSNFRIEQLPEEMLSWISHVLQIAASSLTVARRDGTKHMTEFGGGGLDTAPTLDTLVTPSSLCYPRASETWSPSPSFNATEPANGPSTGALQESVRRLWELALYEKPLATWHRRFVTITGKAPCTSKMEPTCVRSLDS